MKTSAETSLTFHTGHSLHAKDTIRIPESHTLHVGPAACARRHVIKALEKGCADEVSFLAVSEQDLAKGTYEDEIVDAIARLNETLPARPRVYLVCMKCVDDLIGTDEDALLERLEERFAGQRFGITHIDPIALSQTVSPAELNKGTLYRFIEPDQPKDNGITLAGAFARIPADCEFYQVIDEWGAGPVRNIFDCATFDEYQGLGKSRATILTAPMGFAAARTLESIAGIPFCEAEFGYDPAGVAAFYRALAHLMGKDAPSQLDAWEREAADALVHASACAGECPIVVDSSAAMQPYLLAKTLMEYGFNVCCISTKGVSSWEKDARAWILEQRPDMRIVRTHSYKAAQSDAYHLDAHALVIGADFARMVGLHHAVDMWHDEGFFGFSGIVKLAHSLEEALR